MRHIDDGRLRRLIDDPTGVTGGDAGHLASCARCRERRSEIGANARFAGALLSDQVEVDVPAALTRVRRRGVTAAGTTHRARTFSRTSLRRSRRLAPVTGAAAALAVAGAVLLTPAGSLAQDFITIFQPGSVTAVTVTKQDLHKLRELSRYGTFESRPQVSLQQVTTLRKAEAASGMTVAAPSWLPADVVPTVRYQVIPATSASFIFSAEKARAAAAARGHTIPPMPANIDGSRLEVTVPTAVAAVYGKSSGDVPSLVIGQMHAPILRSSGVSVKELENYLLSLPGISPQFRAEIAAIGDPSSTLPIPVPVDWAHGQPVEIDGVRGLAIGDSTGLGSGVIWEKNLVIHGVAGPISLDEVLGIARSLR